MTTADRQHLAWLARSFGRPDYLPLSEADLAVLGRTGQMVTKYPGTHLFREGDAATSAYLLRDGHVDLYRGRSEGRQVVARVGPGAVIGDIAMFTGRPYISSARAVGRVSAFQFHRDLLVPELARSPAITLRWLVASLTQLERTQRRVLNLMHKTVLAQVALLLVDEADARGEVGLSQATMATLLGASRQTVNEALNELKRRGHVETGYRLVRVLDPAALRQVAAD
ncbi:MAG: Crp/Fnr family transcriptional regulator [Acidimicrobiia bacterium]|nr:Crp/Fnr family transcriptional regulator [Acidimicrobiia bacterium]MBT8217362.1 Crp/Fnr family transcriptional regulator [Acidimicrobiia bacterium]NNF10182.1 Crp/Fnr family transcriptional regulator [Acidimicrobiia bacterium]NNL69078.1 Crp/Fnr family transcriptional regulator [Acidimicrobiia bacterium]